MKAIAVRPLKPGSIHFRTDVPEPRLDDVPAGRGVLVQILQVGVCGTDDEINRGLYGKAPPGFDYLVLGHESLGKVIAAGEEVSRFRPGDIVAPTVRRPGKSFYDQVRYQDLTLDEAYFERGISAIHGFLSERIVEHEEFLVKVPPQVAEVGVLMEPMSVVQKGVRVAWAVQNARIPFFEPRRALVTGAGPVGQLAAMVFRLRGLETVITARTPGKHLRARLAEEIGATYVASEGRPLREALKGHGPFDIVFEATSSSRVAFEVREVMAKNAACIWNSITGGSEKNEIDTHAFNQDTVLGNKLYFGTVNAHQGDFERGARDFERGAAAFKGWLPKLLSHQIDGLESYEEIIRLLGTKKDAVKVYVAVSGG
jgi:threonine dehydrogenase-like Zn-dependent dehydrogenase